MIHHHNLCQGGYYVGPVGECEDKGEGEAAIDPFLGPC